MPGVALLLRSLKGKALWDGHGQDANQYLQQAAPPEPHKPTIAESFGEEFSPIPQYVIKLPVYSVHDLLSVVQILAPGREYRRLCQR